MTPVSAAVFLSGRVGVIAAREYRQYPDEVVKLEGGVEFLPIRRRFVTQWERPKQYRVDVDWETE